MDRAPKKAPPPITPRDLERLRQGMGEGLLHSIRDIAGLWADMKQAAKKVIIVTGVRAQPA